MPQEIADSASFCLRRDLIASRPPHPANTPALHFEPPHALIRANEVG